jgi:amino acid adenylation domain-containing protein/thioester reductase-like protein
MLSPEERATVLERWNTTAAPWLEDRCVHQLFEERARLEPDRIALVCGETELTFRQLDERAERLATRLRALGVGPEGLVAVFLKRDIRLVVALLAVMKAGGAYVPLDPTYPAERVGFMLEDAETRVILSQSDLSGRLPPHDAGVLCLDADGRAAGDGPETDVPEMAAGDAPAPRNLAYVLFTSGSTGRPKGVQIEHRSAVAMLCWARDSFSPEEITGVLASTSICFDLSVFEIFVPLSWGGTVILAENALELPTLPAAPRVTLVNTVPSAITELARIDGIPAGVRTINLAGEPLKGSLVQELYRKTRCARVLNLYGPSEDTTYSTWTHVPRGDRNAPTIGRPIANSQAYILSPERQPVPVGVPGELYLGGAGLARGYMKRPDLTAEKFVTDPFSADPASRLYRTGDLARYLPNGEIQFLGRIDNQVKVRGYRIELGEIEEVLSRLPGVQEVAAAVKYDRFGTPKLVAYLSRRKDHDPVTTAQVRDHARQRLPHFMVPTDILLLDDLPHTPNGKIDRKALPEPDYDDGQPGDGTASSPAASPMEAVVLEVWREVFGRATLAPLDNFFEIGGHSLLAAKAIYQLRDLLGLPIPVGLLFEHPTARAFAQALEFLQTGGEHGEHQQEAVDLAGEAVLDPAIRPAAGAWLPIDRAGRIFLTGATGFVGAYLLMELLASTPAEIHCLVRAEDAEAGLARLDAAVRRHGFDGLGGYAHRVKPVPGRLERAGFGLSDAAFDRLAHDMDIVVHSAASINLALPYRELKAVNVDGTREVIRLAAAVKAKPLHYLSTISVFDATPYFDGRSIRETDDPLETDGLDHGYPQSKWVAERLVRQAAGRGLPVVVHRLGSVVGSSLTGIWKSDDVMHRMLSAALATGEWMDFNLQMNWVPVDYVARAVIVLGRAAESNGRTFHLVGSQPVSSAQIFDWVSALDLPLRKVPLRDWHDNFSRDLAKNRDGDLTQVLMLLGTILSVEQLEKLGDRHAASPCFDHADTARGLAGSGLEVAAIDRELVLRLIGTPGNFPLALNAALS